MVIMTFTVVQCYYLAPFIEKSNIPIDNFEMFINHAILYMQYDKGPVSLFIVESAIFHVGVG